MRTFLRFAILLTGLSAFAQIPAGYYNAATGTGYTLKTQLYNIIKNHTVKSYNMLYTCYQTSDRDYFYENDGTILDIYSEKPNGPDSYTYSATNTGDRCGNYNSEGDCFNREHLMPQSVFNEDSPMVSDPHHILPTDGKVNGMRSNYAFGVVNNPTWTSTNGSKLGNNSTAGYSGIVFEPINEFKGDVARCLLYFAVRYQNTVGGYSHAMLNGTSDQVFSNWFLNILLTWHQQDPVSAREIARNNAIYAYQNNRNPFIDHPEYACMIWSAACALGNEEFAMDKISVHPNPSNDGRFYITSEIALDAIEIYNVNGQVIRNIEKPVFENDTFTVSDLPSGFYLVRASLDNKSTTKKLIVN
ncbi:endonuclease [Flavobacterium sp. MAH-1]|uniref:Endonuclease n=1 Tax=Flavobacterium agri TaxID=2743471 RepID=A0A7Y8XYT1_9FLAO|nr:endonuclease [Flavobacterium agri]NUY79407.1 endonuclease [Flavobacterium agri]NYA69432.1 endonuclease [Flavobacterium agri]